MQKKKEYLVIAGDVQTFVKELEQTEEKYNVLQKHISTQMAEIANPAYMQGVTLSAPKTITTVIISALIEFEKKELTIAKK